MIGVMLMVSSSHRQKIAAARNASRTPIKGLETANQNETRQPESWTIAFVFMLFSQAFEDRYFTERRIFLLRRLWPRARTTSAGSEDFLKAAPLRSPVQA